VADVGDNPVTLFDNTPVFAAAAPRAGLRRLAVRGAGVTMLAQAAITMLQLIATVVLARLLTPADFGLLTIVTTFSVLLMNVGLNGFTEAVLQREHMDHALASNVFWISAGVGLVLATAFAGLGPLLARVYHEPRITAVAGLLALTILFTCLSVMHLALLKRAMLFPRVSANDITARGVSVVVALVLARMGWGYWALAAGAVALSLSTLIGAWTLCRWVPGRPRRTPGTRAMVRFAMHTYTRFMMGYGTANLDKLLVGWAFGATPLGFYRKAYDLSVMPANHVSSPVTAVAVAALSRLNGDDRRRRQHLLEVLSTLALVGMGLGGALTLVGPALLRLLLGPGWDEAGRLFSLFAPGIGAMIIYDAHSWIHLSLGRPDRWVRWGFVEFGTTVALVAIAMSWGPAGIAAASAASSWILLLPALWYAGRGQFGIGAIVAAIWRYIAASALATVVTAMTALSVVSIPGAPDVVRTLGHIGVISIVFGVLYLGAVVVLYGGYAPLAHLTGLVRVMIMRRPATNVA
jgi:O-antigen/teichoic acid export membrane protein